MSKTRWVVNYYTREDLPVWTRKYPRKGKGRIFQGDEGNFFWEVYVEDIGMKHNLPFVYGEASSLGGAKRIVDEIFEDIEEY